MFSIRCMILIEHQPRSWSIKVQCGKLARAAVKVDDDIDGFRLLPGVKARSRGCSDVTPARFAIIIRAMPATSTSMYHND